MVVTMAMGNGHSNPSSWGSSPARTLRLCVWGYLTFGQSGCTLSDFWLIVKLTCTVQLEIMVVLMQVQTPPLQLEAIGIGKA